MKYKNLPDISSCCNNCSRGTKGEVGVINLVPIIVNEESSDLAIEIERENRGSKLGVTEVGRLEASSVASDPSAASRSK